MINKKQVKKAALIIKNGGIIAYPTDTCYGLGALFNNKKALERLAKMKKRPASKKFSFIFKDIKMIKKYCKIEPWQEQWIKKYLPGPYTLIFKTKKGDDTLGARISNFQITKLLSRELEAPYATTSANLSSQSPCYSAECVKKQLKNIDFILDAGELPKNAPSKVIDLTINPPKILRD